MAMCVPCGWMLFVWMEIMGGHFKEGFENQLKSLGSEILPYLPIQICRQNHLLKHNVISLRCFSYVLILLGENQDSLTWFTDLSGPLASDHFSSLSGGCLLPLALEPTALFRFGNVTPKTFIQTMPSGTLLFWLFIWQILGHFSCPGLNWGISTWNLLTPSIVPSLYW